MKRSVYKKQYAKKFIKNFLEKNKKLYENEEKIFKKYECEFPKGNFIREEFYKDKKIIILEYGDFFEKCDTFFNKLEKKCVWACCHIEAFCFDYEDLEKEFGKNFENKNFIIENIEKFLQKIDENPEVTHIWFYDDYLRREKGIKFLLDLKNNFEKL